jgi:hypothetical protein
MSSDHPNDLSSSHHAQLAKSLNGARQDESAEEGLRQGKRPRVAASKKSYEHLCTKNWAETEKTLDCTNRSSHDSEVPKSGNLITTTGGSGSIPRTDQQLNTPTPQADFSSQILGIHQANENDVMRLLMAVQGTAAAQPPFASEQGAVSYARTIENSTVHSGLPPSNLEASRTNEEIDSLLRYHAFSQLPPQREARSFPATESLSNRETQQHLPGVQTQREINFAPQFINPSDSIDHTSRLLVDRLWIRQQAAVQVPPHPHPMLGALFGALNNPSLNRPVSNQTPSWLGNQGAGNGMTFIRQDQQRQSSGMLQAQPSREGGMDSKAFANTGPDGLPIDLPAILALPEDHVKLSTHQVFLRHQIEAFRASEEDISTHTRGRNKPVALGQIGIRCRHCAHVPVGKRQKGSTYFPATVLGLYQAAQNMSTTHMQCGLCSEMPNELKQQFAHLISTKVASFGAGRPYWARAAKKLGFVDTENGIRFLRDQDSERQDQNGSNKHI